VYNNIVQQFFYFPLPLGPRTTLFRPCRTFCLKALLTGSSGFIPVPFSTESTSAAPAAGSVKSLLVGGTALLELVQLGLSFPEDSNPELVFD